jgi:two-component system, OmpR family, sensor histidine kinase CiaH
MRVFESARIRLTIWYLCLMMLISIIFSLVIYNIVSRQIGGLIRMQNDRVERFQQGPIALGNDQGKPPAPPMIDIEELYSQERQLMLTLLFVNVGILVSGGFAGYVLAGRTLIPIKHMLDEQYQFITDSSHELRTPIATLRAEMEASLLEKDISDMKARQLISSNLEDVGVLQKLVNNLLRLAGAENGKQHHRDIVSLIDVITIAKKRTAILAKQKHIAVKIHRVEDGRVLGDEESLIELFIILIDNAIKYSPKDTEIAVNVTKIDHSLEVRVSDHGIGIVETDIPHIFKRFYRADKSRSLTEGHGLGLSIAKHIIDSHSGSVRVESTPNKGTTMCIQFPVASSIS